MRADLASEVFIVAHTTGGLLARAAVSAGMDKLKRLVMLGTPDFGSFATRWSSGRLPFPQQGRGVDFRQRRRSRPPIDTHPGLAETLVHRGKFGAVDLYDIEQWPTAGARPSLASPTWSEGCLALHSFTLHSSLLL